MTDEPAALGPLKAGILRTVVPGLVLAITAGLAKLSITLPSDALTDVVSAGVAAAVTTAYYVGVRVLEHFRSSRWGWLLGYPAAPTYPDPPGKHAAP